MTNQIRTKFEVIIIGGGPGGLSAALWCDELGLSALLLEKDEELGGQLLRTYNEVKNHLGIEARSGRELRDMFVKQTEKRGFHQKLQAKVTGVDLKTKLVRLADGTQFSARAIILATGVRRRKLKVAGEDEFEGRGIIESGKQAAGAVAGQRVLVVGGGDAALENALLLSETASRLTLAHRRRDFRGRPEFLESVEDNGKIEILTDRAVQKISGGTRLEAVELKNLKTGEVQILPVDVLLIRIGVEPNTELFRDQIKLDQHGYLEVDRNCQTSLQGVFAVGDAANPLAPTVSSAVGMGATAAKSIFAWLNS